MTFGRMTTSCLFRANKEDVNRWSMLIDDQSCSCCTCTLCQRFVDIAEQTWNWSCQAWLSSWLQSSCILRTCTLHFASTFRIHEENVPESQAWKLQFQICPAISTKRWHKVQVQGASAKCKCKVRVRNINAIATRLLSKNQYHNKTSFVTNSSVFSAL